MAADLGARGGRVTYDFDQVIDRRQTESSKWHKYGEGVLPLFVADMDFRSPEPVIRALRERVEHGVFGYGPAVEVSPLHEVVADRLHKRYAWTVSPEALVLIPGVIPGVNLACRVLASPGDGLLIQTPAYPPLLRVPGNVGLTADLVPLRRDMDGRYAVDFEAFAAAITERTKVFLLCNPHNPVGRVFERHELTRMAEICLRQGLTICADEVHGDLIFSGHQHVPIASLDPEIAARTLTLLAPSKTFNLAGLSCSIAVIPDAGLRERFVAARVDMVRAVNILGYTAALAAYRDGQAWLDELLRYLEANRDFVVQYVRKHLPGVSVAAPEGTYLAWLDCRAAAIPAGDPYPFFLEQARVALNDGATFGPGGAGFVRLNFGCPRSILAEALDRMRRALIAAPRS
jgi:cystathionine beta-lyase